MDEATRRWLNRSMAALADGERGSFDPVYRTVWPLLVKMITSLSGDRMIAEDVAQQAMLKILGRVSTFDCSKDALAWSMAIAVNEYRSYRRKLGNRARDQGEWLLAAPIDCDTPKYRRNTKILIATDIQFVAWGDRAIPGVIVMALIVTSAPTDQLSFEVKKPSGEAMQFGLSEMAYIDISCHLDAPYDDGKHEHLPS
jgi:hypothetical protein